MAKVPKHKHYLVEDFAWYRLDVGFQHMGPDEAIAFLTVARDKSVRIVYSGLVDASKGCRAATVSVVRDLTGLSPLRSLAKESETFHFQDDRTLDGYDKPGTCRHRANTLALILYSDLLAERDGDDPRTSGFAAASVLEAFEHQQPQSVERDDIIRELLATWARRSTIPIDFRPLGKRFSVDAVRDQVRQVYAD
jgi:hypothetical protein